jgi:hypothetical protein
MGAVGGGAGEDAVGGWMRCICVVCGVWCDGMRVVGPGGGRLYFG